MRIIRTVSVLIAWTVIALPAFSQEEPASQIDRFFGDVQAGDVSAAYETLFADARIPETLSQEQGLLVTDTELYSGTYGEILGWEQVTSETIGQSLRHYVYLLKWESYPTVFEFYFYRPEKEWILCRMKMSDDLSLLH